MRLLVLFSVCLFGWRAFAASEKLIIHEWGTFTSLQDEAGRTLDGINTEDEPLPRFTHDIDHLLVLKKNNLPARFYQGAPASLPHVTMRLETPVLYFYPPAGSTLLNWVVEVGETSAPVLSKVSASGAGGMVDVLPSELAS